MNPFPEWLAEVAADAITVHADAPLAEARSNQWSFGLDAGQRAVVTAADVEGFIRAVAVARGRWLAAREMGPMQFYCWHDAQIGQLRFSLVSAGGVRSVFGAPIEPVSVLRAVVHEFLGAAAPGDPLRVWVLTVP
ncbi:hypothetical protein R5W23_003683 [Gemmata sp. JC673]|uniref:Uncharacterized protein n=1 Tax=Gemmata algarum TaxID=2975278 RepID=A0ABU5F3R4_9BACT|nr:hypothetical protein [Gemmata algarum]MDY3562221.1 hypothetical protein [Gemmata algarum]